MSAQLKLLDNGFAANTAQRWKLELSLLFAVLVHSILLFLPIKNPAHFDSPRSFIAVTLESSPDLPATQESQKEISNQSVAEVGAQSQFQEEHITGNEPQSRDDESASETSQRDQNAHNSKATITGSLMNQFIEAETQRHLESNPHALDTFSSSFVRPAPVEHKDMKRETGPLGGGLYKVRKNGVECHSLKMTPQSFDDINRFGTITTSGQCKDLSPPIDLVDASGNIKNSDRQKDE